MSESLQRYRELERKLIRVRWLNRGLESEEEDRLLDEMDVVWWQLAEAEREMLQQEKPKSLIREAAGAGGPREPQDVDVRHAPVSPPAGTPLRSEVHAANGGWRCSLDAASVERIRKEYAQAWIPAQLELAADTLHAREPLQRRAEMFGPLALVLTGLGLEQIQALGGIQFVDGPTGRVLWSWPSRR